MLLVNRGNKKTRRDSRVLVEAEPQMKRGRRPAAKQLHQMAEIVIATDVASRFEISVIILLPPGNVLLITNSSSFEVGMHVIKTVNIKRIAIWVACIAAGLEPDTPRNFSTILEVQDRDDAEIISHFLTHCNGFLLCNTTFDKSLTIEQFLSGC